MSRRCSSNAEANKKNMHTKWNTALHGITTEYLVSISSLISNSCGPLEKLALRGIWENWSSDPMWKSKEIFQIGNNSHRKQVLMGCKTRGTQNKKDTQKFKGIILLVWKHWHFAIEPCHSAPPFFKVLLHANLYSFSFLWKHKSGMRK